MYQTGFGLVVTHLLVLQVVTTAGGTTRIQATFRGQQARRNLRLAL